MEQLLQSAGSQCQQYDTDQKESSEASIFGHTEEPTKAEEAERRVKIGETAKRTGKEGVDRRWGAKKKEKSNLHHQHPGTHFESLIPNVQSPDEKVDAS